MGDDRLKGGVPGNRRLNAGRSSGKHGEKRRVAVITGTRAEYGLLQTAMQAIHQHPQLQLQTIVTGMHLLAKFGKTVRQIEADGWRIDARVKMQRGDDDSLDQAKGLARGVAGMADALGELRSQIVVVLGDRIEAMAGALAAVTTGRFLAHIHGGDVAPGDVDDSLRHSITKLAHIHLTATRGAARRVLQMGESSDRVHWVGAPGLDRLRELREQAGPSGTLRRFSAEKTHRTALVLHHSCGRTVSIERRVMRDVLAKVEAADLNATCIYPNTDRGHGGIVAAIESHAKRKSAGRFKVVKSLDRDVFLQFLINADLLIGNSSCGIIEAPAAGTPAVNVGSRQNGRERGGPAVIDSDEDASSIRRAIRRALDIGPITPAWDVYGDGHAGERVAARLAEMPLTDEFRRKTFAEVGLQERNFGPSAKALRSARNLMPV